MKRIIITLMVFVLCAGVVGCQSREVQEPVTLKVAGLDHNRFMERYGNTFTLENRNIALDVIPYELIPESGSTEDLMRFMTEYQPDIFILGTTNFRPAVETGLLLALDTFLDKSEFTAGSYPESLLQRLRNDSGQDQLFGLSPFYLSSALLYNKRLFDEYRVDYPTDGMSWKDVFALAGKFPSHDEAGNRIYGYYQPENRPIEEKLIRMIYYAGLGEDLSFIDPLNGEVTMHTSSWLHLWETFIHAYQDGIISDEQMEKLSDFPGITPQERVQAFLEGKAAMVVSETSIFELADKLKELEIQAVEAPGTYQTRMQAGDTFAITSLSKHPERAWEFIEFVNSEKAGLYHMIWGGLPIYSPQLERQWGLDLSAFHEKEASLYGIYSDNGLPDGFLRRYFEVGAGEVALILNEGKSIERALDDLQAVISSEY
ncbi:ABC transporter substrate-binding protein [Xylanibacillus composti]|nr:extracellular solute-binding protein [Xylanibacillus composti]